MRIGLRERNQFTTKIQFDSILSKKMANFTSSILIYFYLYDKLFIQDPIIIMKCEYGRDHILLKKIMSTYSTMSRIRVSHPYYIFFHIFLL